MAVTALGERAVTDLAQRYQDHRRLIAVASAEPIRSRHRMDTSLIVHGNALSDLMSVAEAFVTARYLALRPTAAEKQVQTWDRRAKAWNDHLGVPLSDHPRWSALRGFAEARNAIQHGLGRLTERQLGRHEESVLHYIGSAGVRLNGDLVVLTGSDVHACYDTCAEIVAHLDNAAPVR